MGRPKKDAKYLNAYIERSIHEQLEEFCEKFGQSKTVATERALKMYMDTYTREVGRALSDTNKKDNDL